MKNQKTLKVTYKFKAITRNETFCEVVAENGEVAYKTTIDKPLKDLLKDSTQTTADIFNNCTDYLKGRNGYKFINFDDLRFRIHSGTCKVVGDNIISTNKLIRI